MSAPQIFVLAVVAMICLATVRVVRFRAGRSPLPDGAAKVLIRIAFPIVPPIVLGALLQAKASGGILGGIGWVPLYAVSLACLAILMGLGALVVRSVIRSPSRRAFLVALVGDEGDPYATPLDPPATPRIAASVARVDAANVVFPRGVEFAAQIDRLGFREAWDALDAVTSTLETQLAEDRGCGLGAPIAASATAKDARSRLDTLHRLAIERGQVWADA